MKKLDKKKIKIIVVMPAYNAEKTLLKTFQDIPKNLVDEIILVDDGSHDKTVKIAKKLKIKTYLHPQNRGYGGNQKTCYTLALNEKADVIVMIHPDYQYDSRLTKELIKPIIEGRFDVMLGSRIRTRSEALKGGMPLYKYLGNRFLTIAENIILGQNLSEYHTGFRAFNKKSIAAVNLQTDGMEVSSEIFREIISHKLSVREVPIKAIYTDYSKKKGQSLANAPNVLIQLLLRLLR